jgi:GxxExxY protein
MEAEDKPQRHKATEKTVFYDKELTEKIIACAIEVHRNLGPGLLESTYEECFCHEMKLQSAPFERQKALPLEYKGIRLDCGYRLDIVVDNRVVLELKCTDKITSVHEDSCLRTLG